MIPGVVACEASDRTPQPADFVRPVVVAEHPLVLSNPMDDAVTWPVWGSAFAIADLSIRVSLDPTGISGLVIAGPGPVGERVAVELVSADDVIWTLRETVGGEPIQQRSGELTANGDLILELSSAEVQVRGALAELTLELSQPLGPDGAEAGVYVTLDPGAALLIDDIAMTAALPAHPELGTPLRELATARGLDVGTALDVWPPLHDLEFESLLAEQFNRIAPTEFYWATTRGEDQDFAFVPADLAVNYGLVHDQAITGMFLVWDFALPEWVEALEGDGAALTEVFDEHVSTTVERYAGRVDTWIVVNEAIWGAADIGEPAQLAETLWSEALGPDYIERAFELAHAADPDAVLLYNETGAETLNDKSDFMHALAADLLERGVPIDGVGLQFHVHAQSPPAMAEVQANMQRFAALGLSVHVTELDVSLEGLDPSSPEVRSLQAKIYADVLETCLGVPACSNWTVFGFGDRYAWDELGDASPLLFDVDYEAKPAFFAVQDALSSP